MASTVAGSACDGGVDGVSVGQVAHQALSARDVAADQVEADHGVTGTRERLGQRCSDARRGAGDQDRSAIHHDITAVTSVISASPRAPSSRP